MQTKSESQTNLPDRKRLVFAWAIVLAGVAAVVLGGWMIFRVAHSLSSRLDPAVPAGVVTALVCAMLIAWAIERNGARRAMRLRSRAEVYQAALALALQACERQSTRKEWRKIRAQLLLWASSAVIDEFTEIEAMGFAAPNDVLTSSVRLAALIGAMRADLGMPRLNLEVDENSDGDIEDNAQEDKN